MEKRKIRKIIVIIIAAIACIFLMVSFLCYRRVQNSIWKEIGMEYYFKADGVWLSQQDFLAENSLKGQDKAKLLYILSKTHKYNKSKDNPYLMEGYFLLSPSYIHIIPEEDGTVYTGKSLRWEYKKGILSYSRGEKEIEYYIEEKDAKELKKLFEKYIDLRGKNVQ